MDDQRVDRESGGVSEATAVPWYLPAFTEAEWAVIRRIRFSLKSLMIAMTFLVVVAWAYWYGHDTGYKRGVMVSDSKWQVIQAQAEDAHREKVQKLAKTFFEGTTWTEVKRMREENGRLKQELAKAKGEE